MMILCKKLDNIISGPFDPSLYYIYIRETSKMKLKLKQNWELTVHPKMIILSWFTLRHVIFLLWEIFRRTLGTKQHWTPLTSTVDKDIFLLLCCSFRWIVQVLLKTFDSLFSPWSLPSSVSVVENFPQLLSSGNLWSSFGTFLMKAPCEIRPAERR